MLIKLIRNPYFQLGSLAFISRIILIFAQIIFNKIPVEEFVKLHDGKEYLIYANSIISGNLQFLPDEITRLGVGYPLLIALLGQIFNPEIASLIINISGSVLATFLFYHFCRDRMLSLYFIFFTPSWVHYSSHTMNEGIFLGISLLGIYFYVRQQPFYSGLSLGFAFLIRPFIIWLILPLLFIEFSQRKWRTFLILLFATILLPLLWAFVSLALWHTPLKNITQCYQCVQGYSSPPFLVFFSSIFAPHYSLGKKIYFWLIYLLSIYALINLYGGQKSKNLIMQSQSNHQNFSNTKLGAILYFWWFLLSFCSYSLLSSPWAFECFDRYILSCHPAFIIGLRRLFPRSKLTLIILALISFVISLYWDHNLIAIWKERNLF